MAVSFLFQPEVSTPAARRPALVALAGGRSAVALRRQRVFLVRRGLALAVALVGLWLVVTAVGALGGALFGGGTPVGGIPTASSVPATYEVGGGDTLWGIAGSLGLDVDRRVVVQLLADANGGATIVPGQQLVIPSELARMAS